VLAEVATENCPQLPTGVQDQLTPALAESPETVAATGALAPVEREAGGAVVRATEIPEFELIVIGEVLALLVVSVTEVAVITTVLEGTLAGAVYVTAVPLSDLAELNVPQLPAGAHDHVTPALAVSLVMVAVTCVVLPTFNDAGVELIETEIAFAGGGVVVLAGGFVALGTQAVKPIIRARAGKSEVRARSDIQDSDEIDGCAKAPKQKKTWFGRFRGHTVYPPATGTELYQGIRTSRGV
jgi:hypothetical protein